MKFMFFEVKKACKKNENHVFEKKAVLTMYKFGKEMKKVNQSRGETSLLKVQMEEYMMKSQEVDRLEKMKSMCFEVF